MKLTKEDVYISLKGKTKEELTNLWEILDNSGENQYSSLKEFINESDCWDYFIFEVPGEWTLAAYIGDRKEVTIEQLKELLNNKYMELTKENIYISLRGKSKEELTDLWEFLEENNQETYNSRIESFLRDFYNTKSDNHGIEFFNNKWIGSLNDENKTEVTIEQLKEFLKPMDLTLEKRLQKAEAEVKRLREAIEESKIKNGDWCTFWDHDKNKFIIAKYQGNKFVCMTTGDYLLNCEKITNPELIKLLEQDLNG